MVVLTEYWIKVTQLPLFHDENRKYLHRGRELLIEGKDRVPNSHSTNIYWVCSFQWWSFRAEQKPLCSHFGTERLYLPLVILALVDPPKLNYHPSSERPHENNTFNFARVIEIPHSKTFSSEISDCHDITRLLFSVILLIAIRHLAKYYIYWNKLYSHQEPIRDHAED